MIVKQRHITAVRAALRNDMDGIETKMPLSNSGSAKLDPFLLLAHHGPQDFSRDDAKPPIAPHPHRGFETVTFILDGELEHRDSQGNTGITRAGGVQWLTAGAGVVHSEATSARFNKEGGKFQILQLWVNLPPHLKMTQPRYQGVQADELASVLFPSGAGSLALVSGTMAEAAGPVTSPTNLFMSTVSINAGCDVSLPAPQHRQVLFYVVDGKVTTDGKEAIAGDLVTFTDGDVIDVKAIEKALILFAHGDVIGEPAVMGGPFVMNSEAEIAQANRDYQAGKFGGLRRAGSVR